MESQQTSTLAILFADFTPSSEPFDRRSDDEVEVARRQQFHLLRGVATAAGGQAEQRPGEGLTIVFRSAIEALNASLAMQRALAQHRAGPDSTRLEVRIGVHAGDPTSDEDDLDALVGVVRRLCETADGAQILVSDSVLSLLDSQGRFQLRALGSRDLQGLARPGTAWHGLARPVIVHELEWGGLISPSDAGAPPGEAPGRRRRLILLGTAIVAIIIFLALIVGGDDDGAPVAASAPSLPTPPARSIGIATPLAAGQCVLTIADLQTTRRSSESGEVADLHLTVMNHASTAVRAWKIGLSLSDVLGNERTTIALEAGATDIPAGGTERSVWSFADSSYSALLLEHESGGTRSDAEPASDGLYDHLVRLGQGDLEVALTWCEVVLVEG